MRDKDLFEPKGPSGLYRDPLGGEDPEQLLDRILAKPDYAPRHELLDAICDALAERLALKAGMTRIDASSLIFAFHQKFRKALIQAGRGKDLGSTVNKKVPEGIDINNIAAGDDKLSARKPATMTPQEANSEVDRRALELCARTGGDYMTAVRQVLRADRQLAEAYDALSYASPPAERAETPSAGRFASDVVDDRALKLQARRGCSYQEAMHQVTAADPQLEAAYVNSETFHGTATKSAEPRRIADPSQLRPGEVLLCKLGPIGSGGGTFADVA